MGNLVRTGKQEIFMETSKDGGNLADIGVDGRATLCRNEPYIVHCTNKNRTELAQERFQEGNFVMIDYGRSSSIKTLNF
jgi:hypothetical protein